MDNNFNNRDFEQFVKQNADQYRMFPAEKVWKGIHHTLHTRRRWYGIGLGLLLLTAGTVTWVMLSHSGKNSQYSYESVSASQNTLPNQENSKPEIIVATVSPAKNSPHFIATADNLQKNIFLMPGNNSQNSDEYTSVPALTSVKETVASQITPGETESISVAKPTPVYNKQNVIYKPLVNTSATPVKNNTPVFTETKNADVVTDEKITQEVKKDIYPLTIESVVNYYKHIRARKKLSWEIFFAPTISYRKLKENKDFINSAQALNSFSPTAFENINSLVIHKPDLGLQLGLTVGYPLFKNLKIIGGLQFNISKYDIRAYFSPSEVATIALNTGGGANSVSTITNYRNFNGSKANWLRNLYFSVSAPVGLELTLAKNKKTQVGISGTVQPSYVLSDRAYLISTDYKNYAEVPSLTRKWNINTGFEAFAAYSTGKINWRVGPLVRYQIMSSYLAKYPVKEHLFDVGLKVGITLLK